MFDEFYLSEQHIKNAENFVAKCNQVPAIAAAVSQRRYRNITNRKAVDLSAQALWREAVLIVCTSRTKSFGEGNPIQKMIDGSPDILRWQLLSSAERVKQLCEVGIERGVSARRVKSKWIVELYLRFTSEGWQKFEDKLRALKDEVVPQDIQRMERELASWINLFWSGFGPKQSRNFLQAIGLAQYEVPLDSRVVHQLAKVIGFPIIRVADGLEKRLIDLNSPLQYEWLLDRCQELAGKLKLLPTELDAYLVHAPLPEETSGMVAA